MPHVAARARAFIHCTPKAKWLDEDDPGVAAQAGNQAVQLLLGGKGDQEAEQAMYNVSRRLSGRSRASH